MSGQDFVPNPGDHHTADYLQKIGVPAIPPRMCPFDPGYDLSCLVGHLEQSHHLMATLKISMACWMVAQESVSRKKVQAARRLGVQTVTGGGPFEVAVAQGALPAYLDLCADMGFSRIEAGDGFTEMTLPPEQVVKMAAERGLDVQFELGEKHGGTFTAEVVASLLDQGQRWIDAGARQLVVEGRENAQSVGVFDGEGRIDFRLADSFADRFGLDKIIFEAPVKPVQFAFLDHFGRDVHLGNVRLEEILRVEIYRRGLHSDAFRRDNLRPKRTAGPR